MAKLQIKKSNETGKVPQPSDLDWGELALNYTDGKLFYKKHGTNTVELLTSVTRLRGTTSGTYTSGDLTLVAGTNITVTQSGSEYTIASAGGADSTKLPLAGGTLTGPLTLSIGAGFGRINALDEYHSVIMRGSVAGTTSQTVTASDTMEFIEYGGVWNFRQVNTSTNKIWATVNTSGISWNGNSVLHAGNYNSYALPLTGGTLTGALSVALDASIYGITVGRGAGAVVSNTALGADALAANTTGNNNTATGYGVMYHNTSGTSNVANGVDALFYNQTGSSNVAVGRSALQSNTTASFNTAVGHQAAYSNTTGGAVDAFGYQAAYSNTTGAAIQAFGLQALKSNTTGSYNVAFGQYALYSNTTASYNTAVGYQAAYGNTTGQQNVAIGYQSLFSNTTGQLNVAIGAYALLNQNADAYNTAVGANSMQSTTSGSLNAAFGRLSLYANTTGSYNTGVGYQALNSNTSASYNTAVGYQSGYSQTTGGNNTSFGATSLYTTTTGTLNTAIGQSSLFSNTIGSNNTALGLQALFSNTTASNNTAVGYQAGYSNTTGTDNISIGRLAGYGTTTTSNNIAIGYNTLSQGAGSANNVVVGNEAQRYVGSFVVAIGHQALTSSTASYNTAVGYRAGYSNNAAAYSVYVGVEAGYTSNAERNTIVGAYAGQLVTGANNTLIGQDAGAVLTTGAKNTIIGRYNGNQGGLDIRTASNYIVLSDGDGNPRIVVNGSGNTGVGNPAPTEKLDVAGNIKHTGLTMTAGTNVDQIYTHQQNITLTTGWQDTGVNAAELATGSYIVQVVAVSDYTVGGGHYDEYYTGVMSWFASNTNSTMSDEIALHRAGHAPNNGTIFLRVIRTAGADPDDLKLQIAGTTNNSAAYQYTFKFRRLI